MADTWVSIAWNMEQFDISQLGCGTSFVYQFRSSKFLDKQDVGPGTWVPVNDACLDACKCTEFFRNSLHLKVYKG